MAVVRALLLLAHENQSEFERLPFEVWRQWMPAIFRANYFDELEDYRLLAVRAFECAHDDALEWTIKVLNHENREGENLRVLQKLPENWSAALKARLLCCVRECRWKAECCSQLLRAVLEQRVPGALEFLREQIPTRPPKRARRLQAALSAARLLMIYGNRGDWARVRRLIEKDASFGKSLFDGVAHHYDHAPAGMLKTLDEPDIAELWEWMLVQYPPAEDPDRTKGGTVTARWAIADLRDRIISHLAEIGTPIGCAELQRLVAAYPSFPWLKRALARGEEQMRRLTWIAPSPVQLFGLAKHRRARLVRSGDQFVEVVLESLSVLQDRLRGETPQAQFLWDGNRPKPEEAISDFVKIHLEDDLKRRGIVLGREVQIHKFDRTDIHLTAVTKTPGDDLTHLKLIIEVKGCWNPDLKTAMRTQLVDRYLAGIDSRHGLYLAAWFDPDAWDEQDRRRKQVRYKSLETLADFLARQAKDLSNGVQVKTHVLDFSLRGPASKTLPPPGKAGKS